MNCKQAAEHALAVARRSLRTKLHHLTLIDTAIQQYADQLVNKINSRRQQLHEEVNEVRKVTSNTIIADNIP